MSLDIKVWGVGIIVTRTGKYWLIVIGGYTKGATDESEREQGFSRPRSAPGPRPETCSMYDAQRPNWLYVLKKNHCS